MMSNVVRLAWEVEVGIWVGLGDENRSKDGTALDSAATALDSTAMESCGLQRFADPGATSCRS